jgi:hypothetical protein
LGKTLTALLVVMSLATGSSSVFANSWGAGDFKPVIGTAEVRDKALTITANDSGQALVSVPAESLSLNDNPIVKFKFASRAPSQIFVIWRTGKSDQLHQQGFRSMGKPQPSFDMKGVGGWAGTASSLEFGFLTLPGNEVSLLEAHVYQPGLSDQLAELIDNWTLFRNWRPVDVNVYTGTSEFSRGLYPAPVFAGITLLCMILYVILRRRQTRWQAMAILVFCGWLALDALWQWRLWQQVSDTREQYAGLDSQQKMLASQDAPFVKFAQASQALITRPDARIFIAGSSDYQTMTTTYYLAPGNTFWHRNGPELPDASHLQAGDYIVLFRATELNYQPSAQTLLLEDGSALQVRELLADRVGTLLEVL